MADHLDRHPAAERREVELHGLRGPREVVDAQNRVVLRLPNVREDPRVRRLERLVAADPEDRMLLAERDEPLEPAEQRRRRAELRLDVDRLEPEDGIHERREVELREVGAREAPVPVAGPLHRRPDPVPVAEVDVVAHPDLVAVVEDGRAGQREEDRVHQLDLVPPAVEQRGEAAADAEVELHPRVARVLGVHVVALLVRDHLEGQLVMVAQEEAPLAVVGIGGVRSRISTSGRASSRLSAMNIRGITGKWNAMCTRRRRRSSRPRPPATGSPPRAAHDPSTPRPPLRERAGGTRGSRAGSRSSSPPPRRGRGRRRAGTRRARGRARTAARRAWRRRRPGSRS